MAAGFKLSRVSLRADGSLDVSGTAAAVPDSRPAGFLLVGRQSGQERRYPAAVVTGPAGPVEISCVIPLADLPYPAEDLVDLYFVSGPDRLRVGWQQVLQWLPYPTKFGNLSFKRKGA
ncbi:hypothetical protein LVY72_10045 [Arthrobacter sp. I2-34]|uniref:Uncharacterized protein n=1 Tax=Arthrobacter hankyongi TaxID=2904801 RepID=A0ABS9L6F3_9MICC|nr:hypothetical protein [Arthrobacter hankyongi]MCG2622260.1 hypothetical protein [Arthrobacter hankyongi]